ncbi:hypothetical protein CORC01_11999 [Colletotrichum orchidophilum]|uniref:Uncharacterized protein n=1 Tax=Colletotrichum orchidophilum TaxID=1209926 RepID=A0A1G4AU90_9PEZI|nr:uncharacterized protein CORC01_11999 [Colletotrichum orchidophilum]OHE92718.1 hypothetical protein CORC01_11999 [Colletotrichum orchidophilum]
MSVPTRPARAPDRCFGSRCSPGQVVRHQKRNSTALATRHMYVSNILSDASTRTILRFSGQ